MQSAQIIIISLTKDRQLYWLYKYIHKLLHHNWISASFYFSTHFLLTIPPSTPLIPLPRPPPLSPKAPSLPNPKYEHMWRCLWRGEGAPSWCQDKQISQGSHFFNTVKRWPWWRKLTNDVLPWHQNGTNTLTMAITNRQIKLTLAAADNKADIKLRISWEVVHMKMLANLIGQYAPRIVYIYIATSILTPVFGKVLLAAGVSRNLDIFTAGNNE